MIVTVVGAGNAGYAYACKLVERGHRVRMLKTSRSLHEESFEWVVRNGGIYCIDETNGGKRHFARLDLVTRDAHEAIPGADVVIVLTQTLQHEELSRRISPLLQEGQMVLIVPGYMGSIYFRQHTTAPGVIFVEGESTAVDARIVEDGVVRILFMNVRNALAFLNRKDEAAGLQRAGELFYTYRYLRKNIIDSALHNPNLIVHTIGAIMSVSRIEYSNGEFWMYKEAFTPSIWKMICTLDNEKNRVLSHYGCDRLSYLDACRFRNEQDLTKDPLQIFQGYANSAPKGPSSPETRYILEDVPMGLCLMSSLAKTCGVDTPICDSLINIAGAILQRDFRREGRTVEQLGLANLSPEQIVQHISGD